MSSATNQPLKAESITAALTRIKGKPKSHPLWYGIPDKPSLTFVASPPKTGKTILMEILGYSLATGLP